MTLGSGALSDGIFVLCCTVARVAGIFWAYTRLKFYMSCVADLKVKTQENSASEFSQRHFSYWTRCSLKDVKTLDCVFLSS